MVNGKTRVGARIGASSYLLQRSVVSQLQQKNLFVWPGALAMVGSARREDAVDEQLIFPHVADAAAVAACARRIPPDAVAPHHDRVFGLDDLDRRPRREMIHGQHDCRSIMAAGAAERGD